MSDDPTCNVCCEPRSQHVSTAAGPLTCPRLARGEGIYVLVHAGYTMSGAMGTFPGGDDIEVPPAYRFVPKAQIDREKQLQLHTAIECARKEIEAAERLVEKRRAILKLRLEEYDRLYAATPEVPAPIASTTETPEI